MPKHIEFVLVAYGIWILTFVVYLTVLHLRGRKAQRALARLSGGSGGGAQA